MQDKTPNKAMQPKEVKTKELYFFPGEQKFEPQTIEASTIQEANEIYEKTKKPINK